MTKNDALTLSGPKTPAGKLASSGNSTRHGLQATALIIPEFENAADWERFSEGILDALSPIGGAEAALAGRTAELLWRLRRIARAEAQMVESAFTDACAKDVRRRQSDEQDAEALAGTPYANVYQRATGQAPAPAAPRLLPAESDLNQLIRYEAHLNRQLYHALHELEALQDRRNGNSTPLARVQVHGLPGT